jgi:hypothetical protein
MNRRFLQFNFLYITLMLREIKRTVFLLFLKGGLNLEGKKPVEFDRYTAADLSPELLQRVTSLEEDIRSATDKDVVIIAYEESNHNPT